MLTLIRVLIGTALLVLSLGTLAQTNTSGHIFGHVVTEESEPVQDALITITNLQAGMQRALPAREDGAFRFSALPIGRYAILIEANGYIPAEQELNVNVGVGTIANVTLLASEDEVIDLGVLEVIGARISPVDVSSTESTSIFSDEKLAKLPVERNLYDVAMLAPGTTLGDAGLGDRSLVSFGGASVAENVFYINGMDVTNFYNGLGGNTAPFEFYSEFQVKTGGYGAEFGRSTGGVINAVTKRGGSEWRFGAGLYWEPDKGRGTSPNIPSLLTDFGVQDYNSYNVANEFETLDAHAYVSGPIVPDHLFIYAIINQDWVDGYKDFGPYSAFGLEEYETRSWSDDNTFWGLKLDWQINPDHMLEYTAFSDEFELSQAVTWDQYLSGQMEPKGVWTSYRGGKNQILRYSGHFGRNLTLSALTGKGEYNLYSQGDWHRLPAIMDCRIVPWNCRNMNGFLSWHRYSQLDERRMYRLDGEWDLNRHLLRFGMDMQENVSDGIRELTGGVSWQYYSVPPGGEWNGIPIPEGVNEVVAETFEYYRGPWKVKNTAFYIEDHWQVTDDLLLYLGIRNETFDNRNSDGETWIEMDSQWGPRLGLSWDLRGDGKSKLFATAGRYHLPMPATVSQAMGGEQVWTTDFYALEGLNPDFSPIKGEILSENVWNDGELRDPEATVSQILEPGYQDEFILGYAFEPAVMPLSRRLAG